MTGIMNRPWAYCSMIKNKIKIFLVESCADRLELEKGSLKTCCDKDY